MFFVSQFLMASRIGSSTQALLRRFRSQRPIRGGSLIVTIFGDAIAPRGGVVTLGSLIDLAQPFGLTERLVRTSVARLAQDGWLVARRAGRLSEYRLTPQGAQTFAEATQRIYGKSPTTWDRHWTVLVVPPSAVKGRDKLRDELRWLGFGQLSTGVFAHPNSDLRQARQWLHGLELTPDAILLRSSSEDLAVDQGLVAAGWDLGELTRRYRRFTEAFEPVEAAVASASAAELAPEAAFVIRTLLIHDYRKIHLQDPLLPPALLPKDWIGSTAYELCGKLYAEVFPAAEKFLSATASTLSQPLAAADRSAYARFGGLPL
jgi:phenylacetic acid degradation operon negative regulatory protein